MSAIGVILLAPFVFAGLLVLYGKVRGWYEARRCLSAVAANHYGVRRRRFESDESLRERCMDAVRAVRR